MNVVALISGGKDSCFNMMHCVANGNKITSLANLHPAPGDQDEMDSWMYQTVGHDIVQLYSEAMGLPMFRQAIHGKNVQQELHYNQSLGDETEDLYQLLSKVLEEMPNTQAVSVGAIASNYQRLRVENVASRLGLTVLSYLWERDQTALLHEMIENGLHAILIKVACVGLSEKHLGQSLAQIEPRMTFLKDRYQVHPCGEGGEYESIVLDCPLFTKKLSVTETKVVQLEGDTAYLKLKAVIVEKEDYVEDWMTNLQCAGTLDESFESLLKNLQELSPGQHNENHASPNPIHPSKPLYPVHPSYNGSAKPQSAYSDGLTCTRYTQTTTSLPLTRLIEDNNAEIMFCVLILQDMSDFATVNAEYAKLWQTAHPPARICISSPLPSNLKYLLYTFSSSSSSDFRTQQDEAAQISLDRRLWVQSRSYWAPSNIGPYSQLAMRNSLFFSSGQIGLLPASMTLAHTIEEEIVWSLQSLYRVIKVHSAQDWNGVLMCFVLDAAWTRHVQAAWKHVAEQDLMTGAVDLAIIQLLPGSRLPREANVEWQFIASDPTSTSRVSANIDASTKAFQMGFLAKEAAPIDQLFALPVQSVLLNNQETTYMGISFSSKS